MCDDFSYIRPLFPMYPQKAHRKILLLLVVFMPALLVPAGAWAQDEEDVREARAYFDRLYGSDFNLLNGRRYYLYYSSNSHPFLESEQSRPGDLVLGGISYHGVPINYDLYQQVVILQYISQSGETRHVILNRELVDGFVLNQKVFRKIPLEGGEHGYTQVIREGGLGFYIEYSKKLNYTPSVNTTPYHYTRLARKLYLDRGGKVLAVGSRGSFLQAFDPGIRQAIHQYMRQEHIRLRSASDGALSLLLHFCNQMEEEAP